MIAIDNINTVCKYVVFIMTYVRISLEYTEFTVE